MDCYKIIFTTHITITGIPIIFRECVTVHRTIPKTYTTHFKISINYQWIQGIIIPNACRQFVTNFSSGSTLSLLLGIDGGIYGVLFDYGRMDMPLDDYFNVIFILLGFLILQILCWCVIIKNLNSLFVG